MRLSDDEFIALVTSPSERRNLEFKSGGERSGYHLAQVARAALGLANLRDGGVIILGVEETTPGVFERKGMSDLDLASWSNNDDVTSAITAYADPAFLLERDTHEFEGMQFVAIQVREFDTVPIICKKGYKDPTSQKQVLQAGWCYVRGTRKPESVPVPTLAEMRELFDLATEKGVRRFVSQARAAGLNLGGAALPSDTDFYEGELRDLELEPSPDATLEKIRSRGYWRAIIRPGSYERSRLPDITALYPMIFERSVHLRGWDFPQMRTESEQQIGLNWVGRDSTYHYFFEYWRFYQSGQFVAYLAMADDWRDERGRRGVPADKDTGRYLPIDETVVMFAEVFEFAARLALTDAYSSSPSVHVEVTLNDLRDRFLYVDDPHKTGLYRTHKATIESFPYALDILRTDLIAESRKYALEGAIQLFNRFGWRPGVANLGSVLDELR